MLAKLSKQAAQFATDFGGSRLAFLQSVTEIKSSLQGLTDNELPGVARAINVLSVASKTGAGEAAGYISELSSHFADEAAKMGSVQFAESFASKTAWLVRNTGQDMAKIRALLSGAKSGATSGVGADEQLVVLANLGGSLGPSAGVAYDGFLKMARSGAKALGMDFTNARGELLSFPDILDRLQSKYGDSVTGNTRLQEKLNKAFGTGAAALIRSWGAADRLRKNIKALQGTQGLGGANDLASKLSDIWSRLGNTGDRIKTAFGSALLSVFEPLINWVIRLMAQLAKWLEMFPNITRWLGYAGIAVAIFTGLVSLLAFASGIRLITGLLGVGNAVKLLIMPFKLAGLAMMFAGKALLFLTSPVGLIIMAVAALAYGIWYATQHWDGLKAAVMNSEAFRQVAAVMQQAGEIIGRVWETVKNGWAAVVNYFLTRSPLAVFNDLTDAIRGVFNGLWDYLTSSFGKTYNWIVTKLNRLPGVNIALKEIAGQEARDPPKMAPPAGVTPPKMERGGITGAITSNTTHTGPKNTVGTVNIFPQNQETFDSILESRELAAP